MRIPLLSRSPRRKVVWVARRVAIAAGIVIALITAGHAAAPQNGSTPPLPGDPGWGVKNYKLDDVVSSRANDNAQGTSDVIVELAPGAQLPPEFAKFAKSGKLDI